MLEDEYMDIMKKNKGFSILEYVMLTIIVMAALLAMQVYLRRAVMARYREAADTFGFGRQFEPGVTSINVHRAPG